MDAYVSELMDLVDFTDALPPKTKAMLADEVMQRVRAGASLVPHILRHLEHHRLDIATATRWLDLGFDPNTRFPRDPSGTPKTILEHFVDQIEGRQIYRHMDAAEETHLRHERLDTINMMCDRGAQITPEVYALRPGRVALTIFRSTLKARYHTRRIQVRKNLIVLLVAQVVHPDPMRGLKGFLI